MSVKLQKGQKVSLSKENPNLSRVIVGLGWDAAKQSSGFFGTKSKAMGLSSPLCKYSFDLLATLIHI